MIEYYVPNVSYGEPELTLVRVSKETEKSIIIDSTEVIIKNYQWFGKRKLKNGLILCHTKQEALKYLKNALVDVILSHREKIKLVEKRLLEIEGMIDETRA